MQTKIVFVGAPASGKTSVIEGLKKTVNPASGVSMDFLPEMATEFLKDLPPGLLTKDDPLLRQIRLFRMQLLMEQQVERIRSDIQKPGAIICDRGIADLYVYLNSEEVVRGFCPKDLDTVFKNYDFVYCFLPANEKDTIASLGSNAARLEKNYDEVMELSKKTVDVWSQYPNFRTIPHQPTLNDKVKLVASMINNDLKAKVFLVD